MASCDIALLGFTSLPLAIENARMDDLRAIVGELQDGAPGYYSNEFAVLADGPIRKVEDLKGKVLATNAQGSAVASRRNIGWFPLAAWR